MENNQNIISILNDGSLTVCEKYFKIYGEHISRDKAKSRLKKLAGTSYIGRRANSVRETNIDNHINNVNKCSIESDGIQTSEKTFNCKEEDLKNPEFLLEKHGFDKTKFILVNAQSSIWNSGNPDTILYSSKIKVKPINIEDDLVSLIDKTVEKYANQTIDIEIKEVDCNDKLLEICIPDLHIGCSQNEQGMISLKEDINKLSSITAQIITISKELQPKNINIVFLGDIFHYDTVNKTTSHGTPQCSNVAFEDAYDQAVYSLWFLIKSIYDYNKSADIQIIYVPGNHDYLMGYTIVSNIKAIFSNRHNIKFDIKQKDRKYYIYGKNLIGYTHGDMNKQKIKQWIYTEAREYISNADNIEIHAGHFHCEQTIEDNGIIVRYLPTICNQSPWEYQQGYSSKRKIECFVWNKENLEEIKYINI